MQVAVQIPDYDVPRLQVVLVSRHHSDAVDVQLSLGRHLLHLRLVVHVVLQLLNFKRFIKHSRQNLLRYQVRNHAVRLGQTVKVDLWVLLFEFDGESQGNGRRLRPFLAF